MLQIQLAGSDKQILSSGSVINGTVTTPKVESGTTALDVSLRCIVFTYWRRDTGQTRDRRTERNTVVERTIRLWPGPQDTLRDGTTFSFTFTVPDTLDDGAPLVPSFHFHEWGSCRWKIKVKGSRQGLFKIDDRIEVPIVVFPRSPPPALLPRSLVGQLPKQSAADSPSMHDLVDSGVPESGWLTQYVTKKLSSGLFFHVGHSTLSCYLPASMLTRDQPTPFLLVLDLSLKKRLGVEPDWSRLTMILRQAARVTAKSKTDTHWRQISNLVVKEKEAHVGSCVPFGDFTAYTRLIQTKDEWVQQSAMAGNLVFDGVPSFDNRQISMRYVLRITLPFPGIGNSLQIDREIAFASGLMAGSEAPPAFFAEDILPPAYFDTREDHDDRPEKS